MMRPVMAFLVFDASKSSLKSFGALYRRLNDDAEANDSRSNTASFRRQAAYKQTVAISTQTHAMWDNVPLLTSLFRPNR
jgi:hypothetical protein